MICPYPTKDEQRGLSGAKDGGAKVGVKRCVGNFFPEEGEVSSEWMLCLAKVIY
jgi:hypothetical protein